ncbi:MAG: hybrid sensor histidine kinase/response regulator [Synoicihabitans sp.]
MSDDLSDFSMLDLFRAEVESQATVLTESLLALERNADDSGHHESAMRAAHSLKGAARIVGLDAGVKVAHAMEDCFVAAQNGELVLHQGRIDVLLIGVDLLTRISQSSEAEAAAWNAEKGAEITSFLHALENADSAPTQPKKSDQAPAPESPATEPDSQPAPEVEEKAPAEETPATTPIPNPPSAPKKESPDSAKPGDEDRALRVTAESLNRMLGLASESLVGSRWLKPFGESLARLKQLHVDLERGLSGATAERTSGAMVEVHNRVQACHKFLAERLEELDAFDRRASNLAHRLYEEALAVRMRPFSDGVHGFPRMVRDVARQLDKSAKLEIVGKDTQVDREILEKLEAPLGHLLRNAVDHGLEKSPDRIAVGKTAEGTIRLEAGHSAGTLQVIVGDDGSGIDLDQLRKKVVARKLTNAETAAKLSEEELLEFLFLPGFSVKETVTEISGRGVGLDVVQTMLKDVRGTVRVVSQRGEGTQFHLQLPLTLSVVRTLMVEIGGEPYAFPLANIVRTLKLPAHQVQSMEGRQHFELEGQQVGLVASHQLLGGTEPHFEDDVLPVLVIGSRERTYGLVVDKFLGEGELVVQPLDSRLGKIKDISAGAIMLDGSPILIVDHEDMMRSVEKLITSGSLSSVGGSGTAVEREAVKRVLVVDDSLTVRELERKLLVGSGYEVEVAVDGRDGWNAARAGHFDLVLTDIDMPRMDGIELVTLIKNDPNLKSIPVMIVSYKDREEDRRRGLDAGADYYLTKASFHDETLVEAVRDLIGESET